MRMILRQSWDVRDATDPKNVVAAIIPAGTYEIEKVPNPCGHKGYWFVFKGTKIGGSEGFWRQWEPSDPENPIKSDVVIEEDAAPVAEAATAATT